MGISLESIIKQLSETINLKVSINVNDSEVKKIKFLTEANTSFSKDTLYLGKMETFLNEESNQHSGNFVLFGDVSMEVIKNVDNKNIILVDDRHDMFNVFNHINEIITTKLTISTLRHYTSFEQLVNRARQEFGNTVIIVDSSFRVLASSDKKEIKDPIWRENIEKGYCSYEFITYVRNMDDMRNASNNSTPFPLKCYQSPYTRYASKVFLNGKLVGYVIVLLENNDISKSDLVMLKEMSMICSECFKHSLSQERLLHMEHEKFLVDLLEGRVNNQETLKEKIKIYNESLKNKYVIICFDLKDFNVVGHKKNHISNSINHLFYRRHIYYENYIVLLYDYDYWIDSDRKEEIVTFANENNITIGISNEFEDLTKASIYLKQAVHSVEIYDKYNISNRYIRYSQVGFWALISEANRLGIHVSNYIHPCLSQLKVYDLDNETELYKTLYSYLINNQNAVMTGKQLFIHRNTVKYRINRIQEVTDINFSDTNEVINLLLSFKIKEGY